MSWIDSHCHLDLQDFNQDLPKVFKRAEQQGITTFIVPGVRRQHWHKQQQLQHTYPQTHHAFGIHPWFCHQHQAADLIQLEALLPHAIAIGECGLDLMPNRPTLTTQRWWFEAQLKLAEKHQRPLIIHAVRSADLVCQHLRAYPNLGGVIHGFSGSLQQAEAFIRLGFYIGIGTRLCHKHAAKTDTLLRQLPLASLMLESDAPDGLAKGTRNEPINIIQIAKYISSLRNLDSATILDTCSQNTRELFHL